MPKHSFWSTLPGILTALGGVITALATLVGALYSAGIIGRQGEAPAATLVATAQPAGASSTATAAPGANPRLRTLPTMLSGDAIDAMLVAQGYYDQRRNPAGRGVAHQYESKVVEAAPVVLDHATGLTWNRQISVSTTLAAADRYIQGLNKERLAGFGDWRLPTLEEAMSLMEPTPHDGFHLDPVFPRGPSFIWTADRLADGRGLVIYFADGILSPESPEFNAWVRAVRSTPTPPRAP